MIIPIRCFINNLIAHKWKTYTENSIRIFKR